MLVSHVLKLDQFLLPITFILVKTERCVVFKVPSVLYSVSHLPKLISLHTVTQEVFEESKSLLFKTLRVKRIYDKEKNTVVYVSFNTNDDDNKSRFKSSICALGLE